MSSWYRLDGASIIVLVYTQPRASKTKIVGIHDGMLKIACCSPPVDGKANKELIAFLSRHLGCRKCDVELLRGHSSRRKQFVLTGVEPELLEKLAV